MSLISSVLDMNYTAAGAKTAEDVSQNFLSLTTHLSCLDMNYTNHGAKTADGKLDVSQRVLVL